MLKFLGNKDNFVGLISIPNHDLVEGGLSDKDLKRWQQELLIERLGTNTYKLFLDHVSDDSGAWKTLVNGGWYQETNDDWAYWNGLTNSETGQGLIMYYAWLMYVKEYFVSAGRDKMASVVMAKNSQNIPFYNVGVVGMHLRNESIALNNFMRRQKKLDSDFAPDYNYKQPLQIAGNAYGI